MKSRYRCKGLSVAETLIAASLFGLLAIMLAFALKQSSQLWLASSSQQDATQVLRKVAVELERDFPMASLADVNVQTVPASLAGGGFDGDVVWFRSHINPYDGEAYVKSDGTPLWQCNILYYSIVPQQVEQMSKRAIQAGSSPEGYEDRCPHKLLIRKVIDVRVATDPQDEDQEESLLANPNRFLSRPNQYDVSAMSSEADLVRMDIVASDILYFRVSPQASPRGVEFDIRALGIGEANSVATNTSQSLLESPLTNQTVLFVAARN